MTTRRIFVSLLLGLAAPVLLASGTAGATSGVPVNTTTEYCPFTFGNNPNGPDPDYVTFLGPATILVGSATPTPVSIGVSEEEAAANTVSVTVIATASDSSSPITATATGAHDVTVSVALPAVPNRTYTLHWQATFDDFVHPCSSELPGYSPYTVTPMPPVG
jgi:hypothetical protein